MTVLRIPGFEVGGRSQARVTDLLRGRLAVQYTAVLAPSACEAFVRGVYAAREDWTPNFDGVQFTLGRAWYTHLEQDWEETYFDDAEASDTRVERAVPGLQSTLSSLLERLVRAHVVQRPKWCGPGVHIFPAGGLCARTGGDVHYDTEGLDEAHRGAGHDAITLVLMLQPARIQGGLRVWDQRYTVGHDHETPRAEGPGTTVTYGVGDLVAIDSYSLHQIEPFGGDRDRISATLHAARLEDGSWETWF